MNSIEISFIPNVYPGMDDAAVIWGSNRVIPRNQSIFRQMLDTASKYLDPHLKTLIITSWNEWFESTSIEPAIEWNETYLQKLPTPIPPPYSASISPLSASILVGQSVTFTSTVSGGYTPYSYQWYLNDAPVSGATLDTWTFKPTADGICYVHLKVTDSKANTAQSETARIIVATVPVGGYSIRIQVSTKAEPVLPYVALITALTAILTKLKPKTKRKR
jgi:hypothetical protein